MILFCEDRPVKYIAKRLDTTIQCINSSLQQARKINNVRTNYGLVVRFIGSGYLDEYSFNFGGNFSNLVYWGLSVGVTDLSYTREVWYSESMENASVYDAASQNNVNGNAGINLSNYKHINGSGWNLKAGVIVRPTNEFRFGFAVHTPTWYSLEHSYYGIASYSYIITHFK